MSSAETVEPPARGWGRRNAGFSILETFVATALLGTLFLIFVPLVRMVGTQQRQVDQQLLALREVENVLTDISARAWSDITVENLAKEKLTEATATHLPDSKLSVVVDQPADLPRMKRVSVELTWTPAAARPAESVRLVVWLANSQKRPDQETQP